MIDVLTTPLTKHECKHPFFRVPYKSIPQCNVNVTNNDGRNPMHLVAENAFDFESLDCLRLLVNRGRGDIDLRVSTRDLFLDSIFKGVKNLIILSY
jgi:hypothetical protein